MNADLSRYRNAILSAPAIAPGDDALLIQQEGRLACHYAPFEHINRRAKVVLVGITPGAQQARNALTALRNALRTGLSDAEALAAAKLTASFSGTMRDNLVAMMDRIGLHEVLELDSCARLFGDRSDLVHFTSALRNPVFADGKDYSGNPPILRTLMLRRMAEEWFKEEIDQLPNAMWLPLGKEPAAVLQHFVTNGTLLATNVMDGMPHPSGANAERIAYFLGKKSRERLSAKTDADALDGRLATLRTRLGTNDLSKITAGPLADTQMRNIAPNAVRKPAASRGAPALRTRVADSATVAQAEDIIVGKFDRIKPGNTKIAGFQTPSGRHLALQRDVRCINVWTEDLDPPRNIADCERYPASRSRHSNLLSQAPRVAFGNDARIWRLENMDQLETLIAWYATV